VEPEPFAVSVIIPAFNEASRIGKAIETIRAQTEPPSEIIVIDDGSSDDTASVAESLGARVFRQANAGPSAARNRGIRDAAFPWVAFCDADDLWFPKKLELARRAHELRPDIDFIFADHCTEIGGRVAQDSMFAVSPEFRKHLSEWIAPRVAFFERGSLARGLAKTNFALPSTVVVRRGLLLGHALFFEPGLPHDCDYLVSEDIEWYLRLLKVTDALAVDEVVVQYHRHRGSISANAGRIKYGVVKLGELVAAAPERYADGVAATFVDERRRHVRDAAISYARALRFRDARAKFSEAQRIAFRPADEALRWLSAGAALPGGQWFASAGRSAWRLGLKPALRALGRRNS